MPASMPAAPPVRIIRSLLMFKPGVPHRFRFWSVTIFAIFYQLAGGVYLSATSMMVGETSMISQDITYAGYCSMIGLNIIFPMLFRWKFYFYTRQFFFVSSIGCIICSIVAMHSTAAWLFPIVCFFAGYFKMMGMFSCMSTLQLCFTPTRNFSVFFPIIYLLVFGSAQISGILTTWLAYTCNWKMIYCVVISLLLIIDAVVYFMMQPDHRSGPYIPLKNIDWLGQILWAATLIAGAYIFAFGERYEWWSSDEIWNATWLFVAFLAMTLLNMAFKREPYISPAAFHFPVTLWLCVLMLAITIITGAAHYVQSIYVNGILGYDILNSIDLNFPSLAGVIMGAILAYFVLCRFRYSLRQYFFLTFVFAVVYSVTMYFIAIPGTAKEILYIPVFFIAMVEVMMDTGVTYTLSQHIPFPVFFMNIAIVGFVRCGFGTAIGSAIIEHCYAAFADQYGALTAVRECYGITAWVGIAVLGLILTSTFKSVPQQLVPTIVSVAKLIKNGVAHT